jgi:hypothetical protein
MTGERTTTGREGETNLPWRRYSAANTKTPGNTRDYLRQSTPEYANPGSAKHNDKQTQGTRTQRTPSPKVRYATPNPRHPNPTTTNMTIDAHDLLSTQTGSSPPPTCHATTGAWVSRVLPSFSRTGPWLELQSGQIIREVDARREDLLTTAQAAVALVVHERTVRRYLSPDCWRVAGSRAGTIGSRQTRSMASKRRPQAGTAATSTTAYRRDARSVADHSGSTCSVSLS